MGILTDIEIAPQFIADRTGIYPNLSIAPSTPWAWTWVLGSAGVTIEGEQLFHLFSYDRLTQDDPITSLDTRVAAEYVSRRLHAPGLILHFHDTTVKATVAMLNAAMLRQYMSDPFEFRCQSVFRHFGITQKTQISDSVVGLLMSHREIEQFLGGSNILHPEHLTNTDRLLWDGVAVADISRSGRFITGIEF